MSVCVVSPYWWTNMNTPLSLSHVQFQRARFLTHPCIPFEPQQTWPCRGCLPPPRAPWRSQPHALWLSGEGRVEMLRSVTRQRRGKTKLFAWTDAPGRQSAVIYCLVSDVAPRHVQYQSCCLLVKTAFILTALTGVKSSNDPWNFSVAQFQHTLRSQNVSVQPLAHISNGQRPTLAAKWC